MDFEPDDDDDDGFDDEDEWEEIEVNRFIFEAYHRINHIIQYAENDEEMMHMLLSKIPERDN